MTWFKCLLYAHLQWPQWWYFGRRAESWTKIWVRMLTRHGLSWGSFATANSSSCCSVAQSCPTLCNPMDCSTPDFPAFHHLSEFAQTHVHWVGDAIQPSHPLSPPSPLALNLSQHQGLFQWVGFSNQIARVLEFQHQSFQSVPTSQDLHRNLMS